jgi:hypothetical protein
LVGVRRALRTRFQIQPDAAAGDQLRTIKLDVRCALQAHREAQAGEHLGRVGAWVKAA